MKRQTVATILLVLLGLTLGLTACVGATPDWVVPTRDPVQLYADASRSQATADFFNAQLTATAEAISARATEVAWQATASAEAAQSTQSALLLYAQLTATERAWQSTATSDSVNATSTAAGTATAITWQSTATQSALNATGTVDAASAAAVATIQAAEAQRVLLALERDRMTNQIKAVAPWLVTLAIFCASFGLGLVFFWRRSKITIINRDKFGDTPKVIIHQAGHAIAYDPDRAFGPILDVQPDGKPLMPPVAHPELQAGVTTRDQAIDMARALPANARRTLRHLLQTQAQPALPANVPQIEVVDAEQVRPWLEEVQTKLLTEENA
jgi:hypothetical protein